MLLEYGEVSDIGCLIAPRPLLIESAGVSVPSGRRVSHRRQPGGLRRLSQGRAYDVAGASDRFDVDEFGGLTAATSGAAARPTTGSTDGSATVSAAS